MTLETTRLTLREFEMGDWRATQAYESDPKVVRYQSFDVMSEAESRAYIERSIEDRESESRRVYDLAICHRQSGELIGRIGICHSRPEFSEGTLWYLLRRDCWGKGLMTEAVRRMLDLGFCDLAMRRIVADTDPANIGSIRVLEKCGFRQEAHHRSNLFLKGRWCDSLEFAILQSEHQSQHSDV
jgi:ribosomal-protein-alanine N-acetyltransferase